MSPAATKCNASASAGLTVLTAAHVDAVLSSLDVEAALDMQSRVFKAYSAQHTAHASSDAAAPIQAPQRIVTTTQDQTMLFMPARAAEAGGTAIKIVSVPNAGGADGLPATTLVLDEQTGRVKGVVNARKLTALRNACGSALSYRILHPDAAPRKLVVFGSGAQADAHIRLFVQLWPSITTVTLVVRKSNPRADALLSALSDTFSPVKFTLGVSAAASSSSSDHATAIDMQATLKEADVIVTCTPSTEPLFDGSLVEAGAHIVMIGSYKPHMREVDDRLVERAGVVLVDSKEACGTEAGELIRANIGEEGMVELGEALLSPEKGKRVVESGDVTMFKSVGIGIQDVAVAAFVLDQARAGGLGTSIPDYDLAA